MSLVLQFNLGQIHLLNSLSNWWNFSLRNCEILFQKRDKLSAKILTRALLKQGLKRLMKIINHFHIHFDFLILQNNLLKLCCIDCTQIINCRNWIVATNLRIQAKNNFICFLSHNFLVKKFFLDLKHLLVVAQIL